VRALDRVSFEVDAGEICAVIGPHGAGKSSLLDVVSGVCAPTGGAVWLAGAQLPAGDPGSAARGGIARTFQSSALFGGMTVLENIITGCAVYTESTFIEHVLRLPRARAEERAQREKAEEVLELLRIQRHRHTVAGELPDGVQKRVALGRALSAEPRLLLLDEPMAGMTLAEKEDMCRLIREASGELGTSIVLVDHDISMVTDLCDRVVVLDRGQLIAAGTPDEVTRDGRIVAAYLGAAE
jgi:branched-chain amino acid transport system ATP-binding protein